MRKASEDSGGQGFERNIEPLNFPPLEPFASSRFLADFAPPIAGRRFPYRLGHRKSDRGSVRYQYDIPLTKPIKTIYSLKVIWSDLYTNWLTLFKGLAKWIVIWN
jgi:hypothetical protein